jgi:hypothetical protein
MNLVEKNGGPFSIAYSPCPLMSKCGIDRARRVLSWSNIGLTGERSWANRHGFY